MTEATATTTNTRTTTATATATATGALVQRALGFLVDDISQMKTAIKGSLMIIGRDTGLVLDGISRKHCLIRFEEGEFLVSDMDSRYGTFLNNEKLAANEWRPISPKDELRLGSAIFRLELPRKPREHSPRASESKEVEPLSSGEPASLHERGRAGSLTGIAAALLAILVAFVVPPRSMLISSLASLFVLSLTSYIPMYCWAQSLGKRVVGLKVVMVDGSPLTLSTILFREVLMKGGSLALFVCTLAVLNTINQIFFIAIALALPVLFFVKTKVDGRPFWDEICGTQVVESLD